MKKFISLLLAVVMVFGCFGFVFADDETLLVTSAPETAAEETLTAADATVAISGAITILYTTDAHTYIDNDAESGFTYADVAALKASLVADGQNVLLVDAGDHIQGTAYGGMDSGATIIKLMNAAKYDVATLGNHEFDYGMEGAMAAIDAAEYPYVSCNFYNEKNGVAGDPVLEPYKVFEVGGVKVAFVGITTPESFTKSTPKYFQDAEGNYIYGIAGGTDGADLYAAVQKAVDAASEEADYVIALAHIGSDESSSPWTSKEVIANVSGLDAWIDGHSHTTFAQEVLKDKDGNDVVLTQPTEYLKAVGKMVIAEDGTITCELLTAAEAEADAATKTIADEWTASVDEQLGQVIAESDIRFTVKTPSGTRLVRTYETNLGDLNADAYYYTINNAGIDCDVAIMNGGGVRADVEAGEWSYLTCKTVNTFGNVLCAMKVPGQMILDALEFGARFHADSENGGFLQVAGLTYDIDADVENTVQVDEKTVWQAGPTEYRVKNVKVYNKTTGEYEDLDLEKMYTIGGTNYTLRNQGDGFNMFQESAGMELILDGICEDYMAMATYLKAFKDTDEDGIPNIASENSPLAAYTGYIMDYETMEGAGRITGKAVPASAIFKDVDKGAWYEAFVKDTYENGIFKGMSADTFGVSDNISYAQMMTVAARLRKQLEGDTTEFVAEEGTPWYTPYVEYVEENGFSFIESAEFEGFSGDYNANATRREVADLIQWVLHGKTWNYAVTPGEGEGFTDIIEGMYDSMGVYVCYYYGIINGYPDGTFKPADLITRAEVAKMVSVTLDLIEAGPVEAEEVAE